MLSTPRVLGNLACTRAGWPPAVPPQPRAQHPVSSSRPQHMRWAIPAAQRPKPPSSLPFIFGFPPFCSHTCLKMAPGSVNPEKVRKNSGDLWSPENPETLPIPGSARSARCRPDSKSLTSTCACAGWIWQERLIKVPWSILQGPQPSPRCRSPSSQCPQGEGRSPTEPAAPRGSPLLSPVPNPIPPQPLHQRNRTDTKALQPCVDRRPGRCAGMTGRACCPREARPTAAGPLGPGPPRRQRPGCLQQCQSAPGGTGARPCWSAASTRCLLNRRTRTRPAQRGQACEQG